MTLYNKDGSIYKLSGPNPAMKDQSIWTKFIVHNMKWKPEYREDGTVILPLESDLSLEPRTQTEVFLDELSKTNSENKQSTETILQDKIENQEFSISNKVEIREDKAKRKIKSNDTEIEKTFIYCLPAQIKEKKDKLYGDVFKTIQYENPTSFEAVVLSQSDLNIEMWSDVFFNKETILYPKNGDKRWWKISEVVPKLGGWIITGIPSQDQPSFES